jgi:voltage-gated potassium channel
VRVKAARRPGPPSGSQRPRGPRTLADTAGQAEIAAFLRRLILLGALIAGLVIVGGLVYSLTQGGSFAYGLVWVIDTVTTVGAIPEPRAAGARALKTIVEITGIGALFYALVTVVEFLVAGHLGELLAVRRMQKTIDALSGHHIVCGYGRVGRQVIADLWVAGARCVVVDANPAIRPSAEADGVHLISGDASEDAVLRRAGIERARSIVACSDSDSANVFITLTARELRPDIVIVARAAREETETKLRRAGADRVISPYKSSGNEMARLALHPQLSGVVDVSADYRVEEIVVGDGCAGAHRTIAEIAGGALIVGLRHGSEFHAQPPADSRLEPGDVLTAVGTADVLALLEERFETNVR